MLGETERGVALDVAVRSVVEPLHTGRRWRPEVGELPEALGVPGACFVTLLRHEALLGCIGSLFPRQPLGLDIAHNAAMAAFDDPRLPAVTEADLPEMDVHISVLGTLVPLPVTGWDDLAASVRPRVDGLLIEDEFHRATFLPSVWDSLPEAEAFLLALWRKAGLPPRWWSDSMLVRRYRVEEFGGPAADHVLTVDPE